jgi:DNA-binding phage protein
MAQYFDNWPGKAPEDIASIAQAPGDRARAKGMSSVAKDAGLSRERLHRELISEDIPVGQFSKLLILLGCGFMHSQRNRLANTPLE